MSIFHERLTEILKIRNRYCDDRPFISPMLAEQSGAKPWITSQHIVELVWNVNDRIVNDQTAYCYVWKSNGGVGEFRIHFNKRLAYVKYPVRIPKSENDTFEQLMDKTLCSTLKNNTTLNGSKYLHKYVYVEQEFSVVNVPTLWNDLFVRMMELIELYENAKVRVENTGETIGVKLPEPIPLSCSSNYLHKFDHIETVSEPKVIFMDKTWYK